MGNYTVPHRPQSLAGDIVYFAHYYYPLALFCFFLTSLTWWGISTSGSSKPKPPPVTGVYENGKNKNKRASTAAERNGVNGDDNGGDNGDDGFFRRMAQRFPGGGKAKGIKAAEEKLTPMRKAVFNWLLVGVIITFVLNSANVILHALTKRGWWCGKDYVVSFCPPQNCNSSD
jgi:ATP-binding cassette, subfamily B, vacuolar membrane transporter HMT1/ACLQ